MKHKNTETYTHTHTHTHTLTHRCVRLVHFLMCVLIGLMEASPMEDVFIIKNVYEVWIRRSSGIVNSEIIEDV